MNAPISIRPALATDARVLTAIAFAAKRHWAYPEDWISHWADQLTITSERIDQWTISVAEADAKSVGFYALSLHQQTAELEHCWVLPDYLGRGIGRTLLQHALKLLKSRDINKLRVEADPHAAGFYRRLGGVEIGFVNSYPPGRTLPVIEYDLTA